MIGQLDLQELVYTSHEHAESLSRYRVHSGDLVTAAMATTGRTALINDQSEGALISQHLIRVAPDRAVCDPHYLHACFMSQFVKLMIESKKRKTTRDALNTDDVRNFRIPLPPRPVQDRIVDALLATRGSRVSTCHMLKSLHGFRKAAMRKLIPTSR